MGMIQAIGGPSGSLFNAKGRADIGFWYNVGSSIVTVGVLYVAVHIGVAAVAASHSLISIATMPAELYLLWRVSRLRPLEYVRQLAAPAVTSGIMGVCVYAPYLAIRGSLRPVPCLALLIAEGVAVYMVEWRLYRRDYMPELWRLLVSRA